MKCYILLTHSHFDHIYGLNEIIKLFPKSQVITNGFGSNALCSPKLNLSHFYSNGSDFVYEGEGTLFLLPIDGSDINLCGQDVRIIATLGYDPSCLSCIISGSLFTGDRHISDIKVLAYWPKSNKVEARKNEDLLKKLSDENNLRIYSDNEMFMY